MKAYTLKKKKDTEEYHLFEGVFTSANTCNTNSIKKSICEKMNQNECDFNEFICEDEIQARLKIARIGRPVCGICTSHLYTTFE